VTSSLKAATHISAVTLVSRVLGLVRDVIMFRMLGFTWAVGTFALAWMIPNMLRRLFGEGALAASFIPAYAKVKEREGADAARVLLGSVSGLLLAVLACFSVVVVVGCLFVPAEWIGHGSEAVEAQTQGQLLLDLTIILFPYSIPICLAAILTGALNAHGTFALPAASPIVLNVFWIGGLVIAWATGMTEPVAVVKLIAWMLLIGGLGQLSLSLVPLARRGLLAKPTLPRRNDPARAVIRTMGPTLIGMSLLQLNSVLDQVLALYLVDANAPAFIYQANRLLLFPHALTSLALATVIFPRMASLGATDDRVGVRHTVDLAMHHTILVAMPAAVGMMLVAQPLLDVMLGGSLVTGQDIETAAMTTICLVASLPMIGVAQLHARALYSVGDYRTPAWMAFWLLVLNAVLDIVFVVTLDLGVPGLAIATTIASAVNAATLRHRVRKLCPVSDGTPRSLWSTIVACAVMAVVVVGVKELFNPTTRLGTVFLDLLLPVSAGMVSYVGIQYLFGERRLRMR
jgi:putative peptidoglycan lipid II flippase